MLAFILAGGLVQAAASPVDDRARLDDLQGVLLLRHHRCTRCHAPDAGDDRLVSPAAPDLSNAATRITPSYLRELLLDPQGAHPGTSMPGLVHGADASETAEDLVHYLTSLTDGFDGTPREIRDGEVERGRWLYHRKGCVACHEPHDSASDFNDELDEEEMDFVPGAPDPLEGLFLPRTDTPHPPFSRKTHVDPLTEFLLDPLATRPDGRMPSMLLERGEARALAQYLLHHSSPPDARPQPDRFPGVNYDYFETPAGSVLPNFDTLTPTRSGSTKTPDLVDVSHRADDYAVRFSGGLIIPEAGSWTFFTTSDDGSKLYIDGQEVVDNDGVHGMVEQKGTIELTAGEHAFVAAMFERSGGEALEVRWEGPGQKKDRIPTSAFRRSSLSFRPADAAGVTPDPARVARGKEAFTALGCAQCHPLEKHVAAMDAPALADLPSQGGCLADEPAEGLPRYAFRDGERARIAQALASPAERLAHADTEGRIVHRMAQMNCYACHARNDQGGPTLERNLYFDTVTKVDMGDEGRIPPPLSGVGSKHRPDWLREVLVGRGRIRPHMATQMPAYPKGHTEELVAWFDKADQPASALAEPEFDLGLAEAGRMLMGKEGLSCIECHGFAGMPSLGIPAGDLVGVHGRVEYEWFQRYMLKPFRMRPGTRMPSFFKEKQLSAPDALGGDASKQIEALWHYLSLGASAPLPRGLKADPGAYDLIPIERPILVGVFMRDVSPRTVAVGFPERTHYAFDVAGSRLAKMWRGEFFNAEGTWHGRAGKLELPKGADVQDLPPGPSAARLQDGNAPWPTATGRDAGVRAVGRRTDEAQRPVWTYRVGETATVSELIYPELQVGGGRLVRTWSVTSTPNDTLWLRVAVGRGIAPIDGGWRVESFGDVMWDGEGAVICSGPHGEELRLPVACDANGRGALTLRMAW